MIMRTSLRRPRRLSRPIVRTRRGISLVESLTALSLLGIMLSSIATTTFQLSRKSYVLATDAARAAVLSQQTNRLVALPFDSLVAHAGCTTVAAGAYPHTRCVTVTDSASVKRTVRVVITPASSMLKPDTLVLRRAQPVLVSPFAP
jgi:type II secretory pathway pseudopilin PulG